MASWYSDKAEKAGFQFGWFLGYYLPEILLAVVIILAVHFS